MRKAVSILLALVMVFALAACGQPSAPAATATPPAAETSTPAPAPEGPVDGEFISTTIGHEGNISVATTFAGDEIKKIEVLTHDETVGVGTYAVSMYPNRIVEAQSIEVDAVSGATITSMAIKRAVSEIIMNSGRDIDAYSTEVVKEVTPTTVEEDVDVVIVGAGTAGLIMAGRLAEAGVNVLVFEKNDIPGGTAAVTYSGVMGVGSKMQLATDGENAATVDSYLERTQPSVDPEAAVLGADQPYWRTCLESSGKLIDWMDDIGIGFFSYGTHYRTSVMLAPGSYQGGAGYMVEFLANYIGNKGGRIIYSTPVTGLIQAEDGSITGVTAEGEDGTSWTVTAKATVLASGGFAANKEMMNEYYPQYADYTFNCTPGSTGEGIKYAIAAGAGVECMGRQVPSFLSTYASRYELAFVHYTTPGVMVNIKGVCIGDITKNNHSMLSAAKSDPENGDTFYYVFDQAARIRTSRCLVDGLPYGIRYEPMFDKGEAVWYESVEAAAEALNLPELPATIEANNAAFASGEPDEFGRTNLDLIDDREGIWLVQVDPNWYLTSGGLMCDLSGHIQREDRTIIENLYGAGDVLGSLEEKDGRHYGNGFAAATMFGYVVADTIMADIA